MAVTANQIIKAQGAGRRVKCPVAASTRIYEGTMVFAVAGSGYADDDTASGANHFQGIAIQEGDNSSGSAGDIDIECYQEGTFRLAGSSLTQAMVGDKVYASDNYTVTTTSTNNTLIGRIVEFISATEVAVKIEVGEQS